MAQRIIGHSGHDAESNTSAVARVECTRQLVIVAGKMAAVLTRCGTMVGTLLYSIDTYTNLQSESHNALSPASTVSGAVSR